MARKLKYFFVLAMLALVPLRAYAAVSVGLCAAGEGGIVTAQVAVHHHGVASDGTSPGDDTRIPSLACSLCTACCTGASLAPDARRVVALASADFERIPFFGRDPGAPHPDKLERPPLPR